MRTKVINTSTFLPVPLRCLNTALHRASQNGNNVSHIVLECQSCTCEFTHYGNNASGMVTLSGLVNTIRLTFVCWVYAIQTDDLIKIIDANSPHTKALI